MTNSKKAEAATAKRKAQTMKAHQMMMKKLTRDRFIELYDGEEGLLNLEEIRKGTEYVKNAEFGKNMRITKAYKGGSITYTFFKDGMSALLWAAVNYGGEEFKVRNGSGIRYGRFNDTKVSIDYDMLDFAFRLVKELAEKTVADGGRDITCRLVPNPEGGYALIVPKGIEIKRVLYGKEADNE